jgi:predicted TIM-barrel fold metal-dependent hydrolase
MNLKLFDAQTSILGVKHGEKTFISAENLIEEMDFCHVDKAVSMCAPDELEIDFQIANQKLIEACDNSKGRILPCPIIVPNSAKDINSEDIQVDQAIKANAAALRIRTGFDNWEIVPWISDNLFKAIASRKVPLMVSVSMNSFKEIAELAHCFPEIPIIVYNATYRNMRHILPFLDSFRNTFLSIGSSFTVHLGIKHLVQHVGAKKLVSGTGFPQAEMMSSITQLVYADISDEEKQLIGTGNMEALIDGIVK